MNEGGLLWRSETRFEVHDALAEEGGAEGYTDAFRRLGASARLLGAAVGIPARNGVALSFLAGDAEGRRRVRPQKPFRGLALSDAKLYAWFLHESRE